MKKIVAFYCVLIVGLFASSPLAGALQDTPWKVSAEKMTRSVDNQEVIAEGDVEIVRTGTPDKPVSIFADWVRYDIGNGVVYAKGNVRMRSSGENVDTDSATIVLGDETAIMQNSKVYIEEQSLHFQAEEARKDGEMTYWFKNAVFTTCEYDDNVAPVWSLESKDVDINVEGFIWLKHSFLKIKDVPVMYLPYMGFPGRMKRQTGFLIPEVFNSNRDGAGLVTPVFVNLSPSSDVTLYPGFMSKRGVLLGAEFRHVNSENSKLTVAGTYIHDRTQDTIFDDYQTDGYLRTTRDRYWLRGKIDHDFGHDLIGRVDFDTASDRDYLMEFSDGLTGFDAANKDFLDDYNRGLLDGTLGWRQSTAQIEKSWDMAFVGGKMMLVDDLDPGLTPNSSVVHSLPHLLTRGNLELWDTSINFNWDADYVNYYTKEGIGSQRVSLSPSFDAPLPIADWLEASISGGLNQSLWAVDEHGSSALWDEDTSPSRTSWAGKLDFATTFQRNFDMNMGSVKFFNHMVRPEVTYTYVDVIDDQDDLPYFDAYDRIEERSVLGYGFANYFRVGGLDADGKAWSRYFGSFKINQGYDFNQDDTPFEDVVFDLDIYPIEGLRINYKTNWNVYGEGIVFYDLLARYASQRGDFIGVDYEYDKFGDIHSINAEAQIRLSRTLAGRVEFIKSLNHEDSSVTKKVALLYQPGCWGLKLEYADSHDDKRIALMFSIIGAGQSYGFGSGGDFGSMETLERSNAD